ncbi:STE-domain-containing protein [Suhomyces tanzawaensis NRRL Y-17324]|uniref:STE-domain-containing protein n=1 Tax=Suhomyces tanzawaensis NRRL Y-17324 TaxID=984487 RepID=A0A1E4SDP5_9ASCO|nr:STE-domain-containing protein [Suhomyces tanzawaensis NRRL Y-17324]ODV77512.1 STE-domain-containing protein [Suhomyces tanzawaensis NRRL Y-17324]
MSNKPKVKFEDEQSSTEEVKESLRLIEDLKFFLATAPANWQENQVIRRYYLNHDEGFVSCVFWNNLYFITGTDIVRCIVYKFNHFGRKIIDRKKFEEGIFSDLRNLKCDTDAILEPPRSEFLEFLFKNSCLRTQKKQKVFFWFNVPHDKLMADALERDLKKEKLGQSPTTIANKEPAKSFKYDENANLFTQLADHIDRQKRLTETPSSFVEGSSSSTYRNQDYSNPATATATTTNSTLHTNQVHPKDEGYSFLNQDTPAQYKTNSDYEDDFPLDYFDPNEPRMHEEYITLDPNYHPGGAYGNLTEDNYDSIVDPLVFTQPNMALSSTNQVAYNDEYLIEQTQPLKTPLPPIQQPKSAKYGPIASASDEFFPTFQPPPLSAKYQTSFPRHGTTPSSISFPPSINQQPQYYDHSVQPVSYYQHPIEGPVYNYVRHEPDYWPQPPQSAMYGGSMDQMVQVPVHQQYVIMNEEYVPNNNMYQPQPYANPIIYSSGQPNASRQSSHILKNKRHLYQNKGGVTKPDSDPRHSRNSAYSSLDEVINSNATKVLNLRKDDEHIKSEISENTIQTPPPSSSGHVQK